jgi:Tol biopolymer transport system component
LNLDGSKAKPLANNIRSAGEQRYHPAWSPDGRQVAFVQVDDTALFLSDWREPGTNVYVVNTLTGQVTRLSAFEGRNASFPTWSPDGKFVAFVSGIITGEPAYSAVPTYIEVWAASVDGSQLYALSGTARWSSALAWLSLAPWAQVK